MKVKEQELKDAIRKAILDLVEKYANDNAEDYELVLTLAVDEIENFPEFEDL